MPMEKGIRARANSIARAAAAPPGSQKGEKIKCSPDAELVAASSGIERCRMNATVNMLA